MDIRVIDRENRRVVNVSRLSLETQGKYVVGLTDEGKIVNVKMCENEKKAEELIEKIIDKIEEGQREYEINVVIEV